MRVNDERGRWGLMLKKVVYQGEYFIALQAHPMMITHMSTIPLAPNTLAQVVNSLCRSVA